MKQKIIKTYADRKQENLSCMVVDVELADFKREYDVPYYIKSALENMIKKQVRKGERN